MTHPDRNLTSKIEVIDEIKHKDLFEQCRREEESDASSLVGIFGAGNKLL